MKRLSARGAIIAAFAVLFGIGIVLSSVQAGDQMSDLVVDMDMSSSDLDGCNGCDDGNNLSGCGVCVSPCGAGCLVFLRPVSMNTSWIAALKRSVFESVEARQRVAKPEPFPPKILIIS